MKPFRLVLSIVMAMFIGTSALAQFDDKTPAFTEPGPGDKDFVYSFIVPEGITVTTRAGQVYNSGEVIGIPGEYITLLSPKVAAEQTAAEAEGAFNSKSNVPQTEDLSQVAISIKIPEGAMLQHVDGRELKGPADVVMIVEQATVNRTSDEEHEAMGQDRVPLLWGSN